MQHAQIRTTAEVLTRAFDDSPIMQYLIPKDRARIIGMRAFFIAGLVDAHKHGEAWVATEDDVVVGGAVWLPPGAYPPSPGRQSRQMLHLIAVAAIAPLSLVRTVRYLRVVEAEHPTATHWYLATLGVDPSRQGRGYANQLLEVVLRRTDEVGLPTYLETDKEHNLAYYARHQFTEIDRIEPVTGAPPTWTMWREPSTP